jgi:HD-GYP domain-containing protein (c-di-GMP phosphodiesterase class II)
MSAQMQRIPWLSSLRNQIGLALLLLASAFAGTVAFTLYEVELRKHDYAILNLAGQLRVISQMMAGQALHHMEATNNRAMGASTTSPFARNLNHQVQSFDKIIKAFEEKKLPPELTGRAEVLKCSWDDASVTQLKVTAQFWHDYRRELLQVWGGVHPQVGETLRHTARYVLDNESRLQSATQDLTRAFQNMMEKKLRLLKRVNQIALLLTGVLLLFVLVVLQRKVLQPLRQTLAGFMQVSQGDFGYQVPVTSKNEIGQMTQGFNRLSQRLDAQFRLTDRINDGTNLSDTLRFIFEEFRGFLPLDWVAILATSPDKCCAVLERMHTDMSVSVREGALFEDPGSHLVSFLGEGTPLSISNLADYSEKHPQARFAARLLKEGLGSAVYLPLLHTASGGMMLVFAARQTAAYSEQHLEWLSNIAGQLKQSIDRTLVMDDLVVSAVSGLAKLAESRDPETGGHLVRMSLYSLIIAEQLAQDSAYSHLLDVDINRSIFRFAPMHDIGKVGVRDDILLKPGKLTDAERTEMQEHPRIGGQVLRRCESQMNAHGHSVFQVGIEIAECHHEKYDGSGYPNQLAGEKIPLSARIVAVADVFDALTSKRPYKDAWPIEKAMAVLREEAGSHFDPLVISAAEQSLPRMLEVYERLKHV